MGDTQVSVGNKGDAIAVTEETAAAGKRSLKISDAPGLKQRYNPHFYYTPRHREGVTQCAFDLRVEPGVEFQHEWRDSDNPYRVGPSLWVSGGKLAVQGRVLLGIPAGEWVHFEIRAGLGRQSTGTWELGVTLPGQAQQKFAGLACNGQWKQLEWIGFVSNADSQTTFYLDNLMLSNSAP